jgi:hypothetical protein
MPPRARRSPVDHSRWQRKAVAVLNRILLQYQDLPSLRWSLAPAGCGVTGEVVGPDAYVIERTFAEWQTALALPVKPGVPDRLVATRQLGDCRITITATLPKPSQKEVSR